VTAAEERPLVTFFVLAYKQEATVRAAIEGAFAQTWQPLEIVLSDDASSDNTFRIMEEMAASYRGPHRVVLNRNTGNLGLIGHLNRVMAIAKGDFVVQNAGDDVSLPERTARLAGIWAASGRRAKLVHSRAMGLDAAGNVRERRPGRALPPMQNASPREVLDWGHELIGAACGWDRDLFDRYGPLPAAALIEDRPIAFRAATLGEIAWVDEALLLYREGGESDPALIDAKGYDLMGYHLKKQRWWRSFMQAHLADMERIAPPEADACRRIAKEKLARLDWEIRIAEAGRAGRAAALPRALWLGLRKRDGTFARVALKYLFAEAYGKLADRRRRAA
jgi:glycosyltransferase involved in cell wall biosynthesis